MDKGGLLASFAMKMIAWFIFISICLHIYKLGVRISAIEQRLEKAK